MITALRLPFLFLTFTVVCTMLVPWWLQPLTIILSTLAVVDCVSVLRRFNMLKDRPLSKIRIIQLKRAACLRKVAIAVAGYQIKKQYYDMGYRWWHILPDGFPWVMMKVKWWKTFF